MTKELPKRYRSQSGDLKIGLSFQEKPSFLSDPGSQVTEFINTQEGKRAVLETERGLCLVGYVDELMLRAEGEVVRVDLPKTTEWLGEKIFEITEPLLDENKETDAFFIRRAKRISRKIDEVYEINASKYPRVTDRERIMASLPQETNDFLCEGGCLPEEQRYVGIKKEIEDIKKTLKEPYGEGEIKILRDFAQQVINAGKPRTGELLEYLGKTLAQDHGQLRDSRILGEAKWVVEQIYGDFFKLVFPDEFEKRKQKMKELAAKALAHYFGIGNELLITGKGGSLLTSMEEEGFWNRVDKEEERVLCLSPQQAQALGIDGGKYLLSNGVIVIS